MEELRKLENEFIGYLRDDLEEFLSALKSYEYKKEYLSKEVTEVITKIDNCK